MKKIKKLDKYVIVPNVGFYGGFIYDGEDIFLCNDHDEDENYDFTVKQRIKDNILYTDITREYTIPKINRRVKEKSHLEVTLEKNQLLIYIEGTGYTIPEYKMCDVETAINQYKLLRGDNNDTQRDERKDS